jgi:hypothetical protein
MKYQGAYHDGKMPDFKRYKPYLKDYLVEEMGVDIKRKMLCLNPKHREKTPSMSYYEKGNRVHCFGCGVMYDIYDVIGIVETLGVRASYDRAKHLYQAKTRPWLQST